MDFVLVVGVLAVLFVVLPRCFSNYWRARDAAEEARRLGKEIVRRYEAERDKAASPDTL